MRRISLPFTGKYGRAKSVGMIHDDQDNFTQDSKHRFLKSLAGDWGEVQRQSTIISNDKFLLKDFSCSGHGGYLLFSTVKLHEDMPMVKSRESWSGGHIPEFYVYEFEEDCAWSLLSIIATPESWVKIEKAWKKAGGGRDGSSLKDYADRSIERYYKDIKTKNIKPVI